MNPDQPGDEDVTAAELALGVLDGEERAVALRRLVADPAFAREVERWRAHFDVLFAQWPEQEAPAHVGYRIARSIAPRSRSSRYWPAAAGALALIAASLLLVVVLRPVAAPQLIQPSAPLVASLDPAAAGPALPAIYDPARGELRIPAGFASPAGRSAELWMIGTDGVPRSLGVLASATRTVIAIAPADRAKFTAGLKLAISSEPVGGSPTGAPTGPILAGGELISS
ncbi:MAG: anti-sigma factor [Novosphingobium sp.]